MGYPQNCGAVPAKCGASLDARRKPPEYWLVVLEAVACRSDRWLSPPKKT